MKQWQLWINSCPVWIKQWRVDLVRGCNQSAFVDQAMSLVDQAMCMDQSCPVWIKQCVDNVMAVDQAMAIVDQSIWCKNKQVRLWIMDQAMACGQCNGCRG